LINYTTVSTDLVVEEESTWEPEEFVNHLDLYVEFMAKLAKEKEEEEERDSQRKKKSKIKTPSENDVPQHNPSNQKAKAKSIAKRYLSIIWAC
jgi:hypothetical protein